MYVRTYVRACMYTCIHVCMYVCMYIHFFLFFTNTMYNRKYMYILQWYSFSPVSSFKCQVLCNVTYYNIIIVFLAASIDSSPILTGLSSMLESLLLNPIHLHTHLRIDCLFVYIVISIYQYHANINTINWDAEIS